MRMESSIYVSSNWSGELHRVPHPSGTFIFNNLHGGLARAVLQLELLLRDVET
jgi:hypothetical protein